MSDCFVKLLEQIEEEKMKDLHKFVESKHLIKEIVPVMKVDDTIGAAMIEDFCARMEAIRCEENITLERKWTAKQNRTFKIGRAFERYLRDNELADTIIVLGRWRCLCCGHIPENVHGATRYPRPELCEKCNSKILLDEFGNQAPKYKGMRHHKPSLFEYIEEYQRDDSNKIGGFIDAFIYWGREYYVLEIKTVNNFKFREVCKKGAFRQHVAQAQIYMQRTGYRKAIIWYYNKETGDEKLIYLDYNPKMIWFYNQKGYQLQGYFNDKVMPGRLCPDNICPRAKKCFVKDLCFGKYGGAGIEVVLEAGVKVDVAELTKD